MKNFSINKIVVICFFVAMAIRTLYIFSMDNHTIGSGDQGWDIASNIVSGEGYKMRYFSDIDLVSFRPPLFPLFLTTVFLIFGKSILISKFFLALIGSLNCIVMYFLGKEIFNKKIGLLAMFIAVFYPAFIYWCGFLGPEIFTTFFLSLAVLYLFKSKTEKLKYNLLCGLFLGLSVLTRSVVVGLIPLFLIWFFIFKQNKKAALKAIFYITVIFMLTTSPWVIRNFIIHKEVMFFSTEGGITFYSANNPTALTKGQRDWYVPRDVVEKNKGLTEIERDRLFYRKGIKFIVENPDTYIKLVYERIVRFWRFYPHIADSNGAYASIHAILMFLTDGFLILLSFWGLFQFFRRNPRKALFFILLFFYFTITAGLIRGSIRYRAPIMPYLFLLASYVLYMKLKDRNIFKLWIK